jgi:hypothetical protein
MSSPVNNFLSLIPTHHRVAIISPFTNTANEETIVPVLQKTRRSSSTATADSITAEESSLPVDTEFVASPAEEVNIEVTATEQEAEQPVVVQRVSLHRFLRLGN